LNKVTISINIVFYTHRHFIDCLKGDIEFEINGEDYLINLSVQDAVYMSVKKNSVVGIDEINL